MERDDELLAGIEAGNPDWGNVYRADRGVMRAAVRGALDSDRRAALGVSVEDVVQEVMAKLMAKPPGQGIPPATRNVAGFLYVATRRAALNAVDKAERARQDPLAASGEPGELPTEGDFEEGVDDAIIYAQLEAQVHVLAEDERYAYEQRIKRGRPLTEVGTGMGGKSDSYAARLAGRAMRKLTAAAGIEAPPPKQRTPRTKRKEGDDERRH